MPDRKRPIDPAKGQRLRQMREDAGLSQETLALAIGLRSRSVISGYEGGTIEIPPRYYEPLARACGCKQAVLLQEPGSPIPRRRVRTTAAPIRPERRTHRFRKPLRMINRRLDTLAYDPAEWEWDKFTSRGKPASQLLARAGLTSAVIDHFTSRKVTAASVYIERMRSKWGRS